MQNTKFTFGEFQLEFEPIGKLAKLICNGQNVLLKTDHIINLPDGDYTLSGWDECFPTVVKYKDYPRLGNLFTLAPKTQSNAGQILQTWTIKDFVAQRRFRLDGSALLVEFEATNTSSAGQEFIWASHALFDTTNVIDITFPGNGRICDFGVNNTAIKFYLKNTAPVVINRPGVSVQLETDQPNWAVWLNRGSWPPGNPAGIQCIGIEAANRADDIPCDFLAPGQTFKGHTKVTCI